MFVLAVALQEAVAEANDALGVGSHVVFVRDHDDRAALVVEALEHRQDFLAGDGVEVARGFIGQDEIRIVHQAAGDRDALLLSAGELRGPVAKTIAEPDRPLVGTQWQLETIVDGELASSVPAGVRVPTLEIISEDEVVFFDGCNQGGANVEVSGSTLSFELASTTLAQCEPNADRVEQAVLAVLDGDVTFVIEGNQLTLTKGEQGLVYRAA